MEHASASLEEHRRQQRLPPFSSQGEVLYAMHEISRLVTTWFDREMQVQGITHVQWWAMMHISENEGLSQVELSRILGMGRASTGKLIERLEASKWIERRPDPSDDRIRRVFLLEDSLSILNQMRQSGLKQFDAFMAGVDPELQTSMLLGVQKIRSNAIAMMSQNQDGKDKQG